MFAFRRFVLILEFNIVPQIRTFSISQARDVESLRDREPDIDARDIPKFDCRVGVYNSACWEALNVSDWLTKWYQTLKPCPDGYNVDTRACHVTDEPWTTTFLRFAQNGTSGSGCTELNACLDNPPTSNDIKICDPTEAARYRYVCYNIYGK